jgi:hypothetical protein
MPPPAFRLWDAQWRLGLIANVTVAPRILGVYQCW